MGPENCDKLNPEGVTLIGWSHRNGGRPWPWSGWEKTNTSELAGLINNLGQKTAVFIDGQPPGIQMLGQFRKANMDEEMFNFFDGIKDHFVVLGDWSTHFADRQIENDLLEQNLKALGFSLALGLVSFGIGGLIKVVRTLRDTSDHFSQTNPLMSRRTFVKLGAATAVTASLGYTGVTGIIDSNSIQTANNINQCGNYSTEQNSPLTELFERLYLNHYKLKSISPEEFRARGLPYNVKRAMIWGTAHLRDPFLTRLQTTSESSIPKMVKDLLQRDYNLYRAEGDSSDAAFDKIVKLWFEMASTAIISFSKVDRNTLVTKLHENRYTNALFIINDTIFPKDGKISSFPEFKSQAQDKVREYLTV